MTVKIILGLLGVGALVTPWVWLVLEKRKRSNVEKQLKVTRLLKHQDELTIGVLTSSIEELEAQIAKEQDERTDLDNVVVDSDVNPRQLYERLVLQKADDAGGDGA